MLYLIARNTEIVRKYLTTSRSASFIRQGICRIHFSKYAATATVISTPTTSTKSPIWQPRVYGSGYSEQFSTTTKEFDSKIQRKKWFEIVQYGTAAELREAIEEGGVDVNCRNEEDKTMLIVAAEYCKVDIMKVLIANGANINLQDKYGDTALIAASRENCKHAIKLLVDAGAQADVKNYEEMTAADSTQDVEIDETLREREKLNIPTSKSNIYYVH